MSRTYNTLVWFFLLLWWAVVAFKSHANGHGWVPDYYNWETLRDTIYVALAVVPALVLLRVARKLPPGRDKTVATWVGWSVFALVLLLPWLRLAFMMKIDA